MAYHAAWAWVWPCCISMAFRQEIWTDYELMKGPWLAQLRDMTVCTGEEITYINEW